MRLCSYPARLGHCGPLYGIFPDVSQVLPVIEIDLNGSLYESVGLARTVIGPVCLLSYRAVPPGVQETAI
ncbi:hypothetical protein SAMN05192563_1016159 [Paraburkholderia aspalathi]|jgi:hypothetical protein|uniref:Uncharacterized protein n=1 Tax=Paraburkholderia aspalathi TaxID=1324617 RepID=A0A1I7ECJ7_9BURK|nr:hypothetical protein SAMN05192563_1016159 [Paraburkholderia aspalathi]